MALDSCLSQTHSNIEVVVVNDGSIDGTEAIIKSYHDPRIIYVKHSVNRGLPAALNTGFSKSTGAYVSWTSDDNYYDSEALRLMLKTMKASESEFIYADFYRLSVTGRRTKMRHIRLPEPPILRNENTVGACFLYSRHVMDTIGAYDEEAYLAEDYDYWIRVSKKFLMQHLPRPLYYYREHPESLSTRWVEVRIASLLVQMHNGLIDLDESCSRFSSEIAEKMWMEKHGVLTRGSFLRHVGLRLARRHRERYALMSRSVLEAFIGNRISCGDARKSLALIADKCVNG
jgi:glycosyltransferase involved in cell wall biosynthesis